MEKTEWGWFEKGSKGLGLRPKKSILNKFEQGLDGYPSELSFKKNVFKCKNGAFDGIFFEIKLFGREKIGSGGKKTPRSLKNFGRIKT